MSTPLPPGQPRRYRTPVPPRYALKIHFATPLNTVRGLVYAGPGRKRASAGRQLALTSRQLRLLIVIVVTLSLVGAFVTWRERGLSAQGALPGTVRVVTPRAAPPRVYAPVYVSPPALSTPPAVVPLPAPPQPESPPLPSAPPSLKFWEAMKNTPYYLEGGSSRTSSSSINDKDETWPKLVPIKPVPLPGANR